MYKVALPMTSLNDREKSAVSNFRLIRLRNLNRILYLVVYLLLYIEIGWVLIWLVSSLPLAVFPGLVFSDYADMVICMILLLVFSVKVYRLRYINLSFITFRLDQDFPILEESASLLLKPSNTLNTLERLQTGHLNSILSRLPVLPTVLKSFYGQFILAGLLLVALVILNKPIGSSQGIGGLGGINKISFQHLPAGKKKLLQAQLEHLKIDVIEPTYTKQLPSSQTSADVQFIQGSQINWDITTTLSAQLVQLLINGKELVSLIPDKKKRHWHVSKKIVNAGFYQISIENNLSAYFKLSAIKDLPPVIHMFSPGQYTLLSPGDDKPVIVRAGITDDFGLSSVRLMATVASGGGESVKFRRFQLPMLPAFSGQPLKIALHQSLDLKNLQIGSGDELFFYLIATDNHGLETRTSMCYLNFRDTSRQSEVSGLVKGLNPVPEYFRSERQLIIDTEKLLKEKKTLTAREFKEKSNDLGIDQQLLRQRYSKFLGEESSADETLPESDKATEQIVQPGSSSKNTVDAMFTEKPDNADDADIFEPVIKAELKAALNQMWLAERSLRTYKLSDARPYEYSALRLLKLVQEKTRAYVSKTSFQPMSMQPFVKRLSGEQSKISNHSFTQTDLPRPDQLVFIRQAVPVLEKLKQSAVISSAERLILEKAGNVLSNEAIAQPGLYLSSLSAMNHLVNGFDSSNKYAGTGVGQLLEKIEKACLKLIPSPQLLPGSTIVTPANSALSKFYFNNLPQEK